jgi:protein XagA
MKVQWFKAICCCVALFISVSISVSHCLAGAWTVDAGNLYYRMAFNCYLANDQFSMEHETRGFKEFNDMNVSSYVELGLTDRFTLINSLYYKWIEKEDNLGTTDSSGLGDIDLGIKGKIWEGPWGIVSTQGLVKIPGLYDDDGSLPLGNGQYDLEWRLLYGRSLYPFIPGYCNFEVGYRWRRGDPSDEFRYLVEFGVDFRKDLYGRIKLDGIASMQNGNALDASGNPSATNSFDLGKLDIALGYKLTSAWGLELGCSPEIYGKNTTQGVTYTFAVTYQLK